MGLLWVYFVSLCSWLSQVNGVAAALVSLESILLEGWILPFAFVALRCLPFGWWLLLVQLLPSSCLGPESLLDY